MEGQTVGHVQATRSYVGGVRNTITVAIGQCHDLTVILVQIVALHVGHVENAVRPHRHLPGPAQTDGVQLHGKPGRQVENKPLRDLPEKSCRHLDRRRLQLQIGGGRKSVGTG